MERFESRSDMRKEGRSMPPPTLQLEDGTVLDDDDGNPISLQENNIAYICLYNVLPN